MDPGQSAIDLSTQEKFISWLASNNKYWDGLGRAMPNTANQQSLQNAQEVAQSSASTIMASSGGSVGQKRSDSMSLQARQSPPIPGYSFQNYSNHSVALDQLRKSGNIVSREVRQARSPKGRTECKHELQCHQRQLIIPQKRSKNNDFMKPEKKKIVSRDSARTQTKLAYSSSVDLTSEVSRLNTTMIEEQEADMSLNLCPQPMPEETNSSSVEISSAIPSGDSANKTTESPATSNTAPPISSLSRGLNRSDADDEDVLQINQERLFDLFEEFLKESASTSTEVCKLSIS
jgi:hypothetical protein